MKTNTSHIFQNSEHQKRQFAYSMCPERAWQKKLLTKELNKTIFVVTAEDSKSKLMDMTYILQYILNTLSNINQSPCAVFLLHQIFSAKLFGKLNTILFMSKYQDSHSPVTIVTELDGNHFVLNRRKEKHSLKCFLNSNTHPKRS